MVGGQDHAQRRHRGACVARVGGSREAHDLLERHCEAPVAELEALVRCGCNGLAQEDEVAHARTRDVRAASRGLRSPSRRVGCDLAVEEREEQHIRHSLATDDAGCLGNHARREGSRPRAGAVRRVREAVRDACLSGPRSRRRGGARRGLTGDDDRDAVRARRHDRRLRGGASPAPPAARSAASRTIETRRKLIVPALSAQIFDPVGSRGRLPARATQASFSFRASQTCSTNRSGKSQASSSCLRANSRKRARAASSGPNSSSSRYRGSAAISSATARTSCATAAR